MTEPQTTADVLNAAADYLEQHGWTQGARRASDGRCCAAGAIEATARNTRSSIASQVALQHHLGDLIWRWNDAPHRTAEQVVKELRAAAADAS